MLLSLVISKTMRRREPRGTRHFLLPDKFVFSLSSHLIVSCFVSSSLLTSSSLLHCIFQSSPLLRSAECFVYCVQRRLLHGEEEEQLIELPTQYKNKALTEEQLNVRKQRAVKRRQQALEKSERAKVSRIREVDMECIVEPV